MDREKHKELRAFLYKLNMDWDVFKGTDAKALFILLLEELCAKRSLKINYKKLEKQVCEKCDCFRRNNTYNDDDLREASLKDCISTLDDNDPDFNYDCYKDLDHFCYCDMLKNCSIDRYYEKDELIFGFDKRENIFEPIIDQDINKKGG